MQKWLQDLEDMIVIAAAEEEEQEEEEEEQEEERDDDDDKNNNRAVLESWRNLPPSQVINEIDIAIANYLKRVRKTDPDFVLLKFDCHRDNPAEFDRLKKELEDIGLL